MLALLDPGDPCKDPPLHGQVFRIAAHTDGDIYVIVVNRIPDGAVGSMGGKYVVHFADAMVVSALGAYTPRTGWARI